MSKDNKKLTGDSVYRVKLYKDGKKWVAAGATTLALAAGLVFANVNANADTKESTEPATEKVATVSDADTGSVSDPDTNTNENDGNNDANVQGNTNDNNDGAKAATDDTATPVAASVTTKQEDPEVTAPEAPAASDANVTSEATVETSAAASESSSSQGEVAVNSGVGSLAGNKSVNSANLGAQGGSFEAKKGATYKVQIAATKVGDTKWGNKDINGADSDNGQFTVKPAGSSVSSQGKWTAKSYSTYDANNKLIKTTPVNGGDTITVNYKDIIDANVVKFDFEYTALESGLTDTVVFTDIPNAAYNAATNKPNSNTTLQHSWDYGTLVTTQGEVTTTPENPQATVNVKYVDANGNEIPSNVAPATDDVNGTYKVTPATIEGYTFDEASSSKLSGTIAANGNDIVLVYVADPADPTNIEVSYVDKNGEEILPSATFDKGADGTATQVGGTYKISAPSIAGYEYAGYKLNGGELVNGTVAADDLKDTNAVQFVYDKVVTVTVNYIDEATDEKIADSTSTDYKVGDEYTAEQKDIDGYTFVRTDTPLQGTTDANGATINVYYSKNETPAADSTLTVNYVDEDGNVIKDPTTQTGKVGADYSVDKPAIDGYTYKSAKGDLNGKFAEGGTTVTLTYTKNATPVDPVKDATITVKYQDDKGNTIKADTTVSGKVGEDYSVEKPAIDGYTFVSADGDLEGTFAEDGTLVLTYTANKTTEEPGTGDNVDPKDPDTNKETDTNDDNNEGTKDNGEDDTKTTEEDDDTTATPVVKDDNNNDGNGTAGVVASDNLKSVEAGKAAATTKATTLPQTDEANGTALAVLGLSTMLMGSALYFGTSRRKHEA